MAGLTPVHRLASHHCITASVEEPSKFKLGCKCGTAFLHSNMRGPDRGDFTHHAAWLEAEHKQKATHWVHSKICGIMSPMG